MAIAYVWMYHVGRWVLRAGRRKQLDAAPQKISFVLIPGEIIDSARTAKNTKILITMVSFGNLKARRHVTSTHGPIHK